jgi:hypothetical protein
MLWNDTDKNNSVIEIILKSGMLAIIYIIIFPVSYTKLAQGAKENVWTQEV